MFWFGFTRSFLLPGFGIQYQRAGIREGWENQDIGSGSRNKRPEPDPSGQRYESGAGEIGFGAECRNNTFQWYGEEYFVLFLFFFSF